MRGNSIIYVFLSKSLLCFTIACHCKIQFKLSISECLAWQCFFQHPGLSIGLQSHHCCGLLPLSWVHALHTYIVLKFPTPPPLFSFPSQLLHLHLPCSCLLVLFPLLILYRLVFLIPGNALQPQITLSYPVVIVDVPNALMVLTNHQWLRDINYDLTWKSVV